MVFLLELVKKVRNKAARQFLTAVQNKGRSALRPF